MPYPPLLPEVFPSPLAHLKVGGKTLGKRVRSYSYCKLNEGVIYKGKICKVRIIEKDLLSCIAVGEQGRVRGEEKCIFLRAPRMKFCYLWHVDPVFEPFEDNCWHRPMPGKVCAPWPSAYADNRQMLVNYHTTSF